MNAALSQLITITATVIVVPLVIGRFNFWRAKWPVHQENVQFKSRLPEWVKGLEIFTFLVFLTLMFGTLGWLAFSTHHLFHQNALWGHPSSTAVGFLICPALLVSAVFGFLLSNCVSWLIPQVRKANNRAAAGLPSTTFRQMNRGLLVALAWILPFYLALSIIGIIDPWLRV